MILCIQWRALQLLCTERRALDCFLYPRLGLFENEGLIRSDLFLPRILHSIHDGDAYTYSVIPYSLPSCLKRIYLKKKNIAASSKRHEGYVTIWVYTVSSYALHTVSLYSCASEERPWYANSRQKASVDKLKSVYIIARNYSYSVNVSRNITIASFFIQTDFLLNNFIFFLLKALPP